MISACFLFTVALFSPAVNGMEIISSLVNSILFFSSFRSTHDLLPKLENEVVLLNSVKTIAWIKLFNSSKVLKISTLVVLYHVFNHAEKIA